MISPISRLTRSSSSVRESRVGGVVDTAEFERVRCCSAFVALDRRRTGWSRAEESRCLDCAGVVDGGGGSLGGG